MPSLATFVGPNSWLLPHILDMSSEDLEWLQLEVCQWQLMSPYRRFAQFIRSLPVVNDPAERAVKLIQEFVDTTGDEELRQARMMSASDQRKKYPINLAKKDMKKMVD